VRRHAVRIAGMRKASIICFSTAYGTFRGNHRRKPARGSMKSYARAARKTAHPLAAPSIGAWPA